MHCTGSLQLCQGIYRLRREKNGEWQCCSRCSTEQCLPLLNDFSGTSHGKHRFLKTKTCTFIHPLLVARTGQDSWFSPSHPLAFLLAQEEQTEQPLPSAVPGHPSPGSSKGATANHISTLNPNSALCRSCPAGWMKEMFTSSACCQLPCRPPPPRLGRTAPLCLSPGHQNALRVASNALPASSLDNFGGSSF